MVNLNLKHTFLNKLLLTVHTSHIVFTASTNRFVVHTAHYKLYVSLLLVSIWPLFILKINRCVLFVGTLNDDSQPQATKLLMFLAVGVSDCWRMPLAYCLTDCTNAQLQETLLQSSQPPLTTLWDTD